MSLPSAAGNPRPFAVSLATTVVGRTFLNTARRFPYTYAAVLARGLGVELETIAALIAVSQGASLLAPALGPLSDRWGYRPAMLAGLLLLLGMLPVALNPSPVALLVAVVLASVGKVLFDPAVQAWVGARVTLARRGLAIGAGEVSWSASTLLGVPLVGVLIEGYGWRAPFFALGILGVAGAILVGWGMSREHRPPGAVPRPGVREAWGLLLREPAVWGALGFGFLLSLANDALFVVYGSWLETSFGLGVVALGAATVVIGAAELGGEGLSALVSDRVGLRRAAVAGCAGCTVAYAVLPWCNAGLPLALAGLFGVFLVFEFTIVTSFSLFNDVVPRARATLLSAYFAALGLGRMVGVLVGGALWSAGGLGAVMTVCAAVSAAAVGCLLWTGRRRGPRPGA